MTEETRMKGLCDRYNALDKAFEEEKLRGVIAERNFQEQLQLTTTDTICKLKVLNEKQDSLCHTMEGFQSQFRKLFDRLEQIYQKDTLILGRPPTCCYMGDSRNSKSPIMPEPPPLEQSEVRTPNTGEAHLQIIPQGINLFPKLEFPSFDGTAASNWLLRSKNYFQLVPPMNDLQKITLASMHFEGRASRWYQHTCRDIRNLTWDRFSDMISLRFDELKSGKIIGEFNKLRQNSSLAAYIEKFEKLELNRALQMHSSLVQRLSLERELEGHRGCVNTVTWNSEGSLLLSGSDDARLNIWSYSSRKLMHSIETGHSANIFCAKFIPETSDELVVSGAGDAEVRLFNLSRLKRSGVEESGINPSAHFQCHTRRVKKLSVEVGNPYVVWSASEDGTLRQHDFRETASCPPSGSSHQECRNILLDLRCGAKKSLVDPPKQSLALKSCDISSTRPHLLLVGGSDAFARLYDRRMLPPLSSSQKKLPPPPCVDFFCPMHLSDLGRSSLHLTHVTFSPNGEEVLLSYSGEHVYLMDVNLAFGSTMRYTSGDVTKATSFSPILNSVKLQPSVSGVSVNDFPARKKTAAVLDMCRKLIQVAEKSVRGEVNYYYGIEACNEVLDGHGHELVPAMMHDCLCIRASLLLKRKWKGDTHMAIRDCNEARRIYPSSIKALICMAEALSMLEKHKESLDFAVAAQSLGQSDFEVMERVENIKNRIATAEVEKAKMESDRGSRTVNRAGRVLSLSDIIYHPEANNDASGDDFEREDSDYDDELEFDIEPSISGGLDADFGVHHRSLNLRIRRRGESEMETERPNRSFGSPILSSKNDEVPHQPETARDMKQRYVGHCNIGTDIKQASFVGQRGDYVASGSDDGRWFIWDKKTGRLLKMLRGDEAVVNCVQCHPRDCVIATTGIDSTIKIWTPSAPVPSIVAGGAAGPEISNVLEAMEGNQRKLCRTREAIWPFEILEQFRMHEFAEGNLHPFECTQS